MKIEAVVFDCGRTLYNPENNSLFPRTRKTLEDLSQKGIKLGLLSVAVTEDISQRMKELKYFKLNSFFNRLILFFKLLLEKILIKF
jgi:hydroxymethylpyrimidine pyrophosphatase-like HAD family hydrolase